MQGTCIKVVEKLHVHFILRITTKGKVDDSDGNQSIRTSCLTDIFIVPKYVRVLVYSNLAGKVETGNASGIKLCFGKLVEGFICW